MLRYPLKNLFIMKRLFIIAVVAVLATSCNLSKFVSTGKHNTFSSSKPYVADVYADLEVSTTKISHFYIVPPTVAKVGYDNVVNTAVREALLSNGNGDVLVGLETQAKYNRRGLLESITVTGYPAKYVNFRRPTEEDLKFSSSESKSNGPALLGGLGKVVKLKK